jgi:hypothetical protein
MSLSRWPLTIDKATHRTSCPLLRRVALVLLSGAIHREAPCSVLPNDENRGHVPTAITIIWRRPYGSKRLVKHIFVAFLHKLMCACDEGKRIDMIELHIQLRHRNSESEREDRRTSRVTLPPKSHPAPRGLTPQFSTSSGSDHMRSVTPLMHHIFESKSVPCSELTAECAFVRNFLRPRENANLVESANVWREASVDTEYFAVNDLPMHNE